MPLPKDDKINLIPEKPIINSENTGEFIHKLDHSDSDDIGEIYKPKYGLAHKPKKLKYLKNHIENGYEEPIHVFLPSIGISELIILPNSFDKKWNNNALVTSLNGRSIYRVKFEDKTFNKITYVEEIYIGERIRDIKYVDKLNFIVVALERTGDIGIIKNY